MSLKEELERLRSQRSDRIVLGINHHISEIMDIRCEYIEMMAMAYLKMTDIHPSEAELVEERDGLTTKWYFRRRND